MNDNININDSDIKPELTFRNLCFMYMKQLINFPYIEKDFDAITDYQLLCLVVKHLNKVIDNTNKQNESITNLYNAFLQLQNYMNNSVEELEDAFNTLNDYVRDYFANLDVQDEINNKLDQMLEDGVLTEIIQQFLQSTAIWCFDTVADMKQATNLIDGSYARTLGYYSINDGGDATYKITDTESETDYQETLESGLYATLILDKDINVDKFGVYGDGTHNDTELIQTLLNKYNNISLSKKTYIVKGLSIKSNQTITGNGAILKGDGTTEGLKIYNDTNGWLNNISISNLTIQNHTYGILAINCYSSIFEKIKCVGCNVGANFTGATWANKFYNCNFRDSTSDGFQVGLPMTHPITGQSVEIALATFDFYNCIFGNNGGFGINGLMRVFNFFGGYAENNINGAMRVVSFNTGSLGSEELTVIGFDIENETIGYLFENPSGPCSAQYINILGGQVALNTSESISALLYFKGTQCTMDYNHNINVTARHNASTALDIYTAYIDVPQNATKTLQLEVNCGNINNSNFKTNATVFLPNNLMKITDNSIPLAIFTNDYFDGTNLVLPGKKSVELSIPDLKYLNNIKISTSTSSISLTLRIFGSRAVEFRQTGSGNGTVDDGLITITSNIPGNIIKISNPQTIDVTITGITITGYLKR